jgi:DNA-binding response OmpR family regulator
MKVLVAEDDDHIREGIVEVLEGEGYLVHPARDGAEALEIFDSVQPDFVCLDIMMPEVNGYDVCKKIRSKNEAVPIIFLSAKSEEIDRVLGLELGADDYIMKPFGVKEFIARIRAISRRALAHKSAGQKDTSFSFGDILVSPDELRGKRGEEVVDFSLRELALMRAFADHPGEVLDRDALFSAGWGIDSYPNSRTLDQHISKLRKKVEADPKNPHFILTVHGAGYRYQPT